MPSADPVKDSAGTVPADPVNVGAAWVGTLAGQATVPAGVNNAVLFVPAGVMDETPPDGLAVVADTTSPDVGALALPPVAVEVITCVPVVAAVVPPWTL